MHQDGSGAHDTNHRTAIINLILPTQKYFQIQSRRAFFNQIGGILEFNDTAQKTTFLSNLVQELLGTPQREHVQHDHISN